MTRSLIFTLTVQLMLAGALGTMPGATPARADTAEALAYLEDARDRLAAGELRAAIIQLRNALREDPENLEARRLLGELYLRTNDPASAEAQLMRVFERAPSEELAILVAQAQFGVGQPALAAASLEPFLDGDHSPTAALLHAEALLLLGRVAEAAEHTAYALAADPRGATANMVEARRLAMTEDLEAARTRALVALEAAPDDPQPQLLLSRIALAAQDHDAAEAAFAEAERLAPDTLAVNLFGMELATRSGDADRIRRYVDAVLAVDPDNVAANFELARLQARAGDYEAADETLQPLTEALRDIPQALVLQGLIKLQLEQTAQARDLLGRYLFLREEDAQVRNLLASLALADEAPRAALQILEPLIRDAASQNLTGLVLLSSAQVHAEDLEAAADTFRRISNFTGTPEARQASAFIGLLDDPELQGTRRLPSMLVVVDHVRFARLDEAAAGAMELLEAYPSDDEVALLAATVRLARNEDDAARILYEEVATRDPENLEALDGLVRLALRADDQEAVEAHLQRWRAQSPDADAVLLRLANFYVTVDRAEDARTLLAEQLARRPEAHELRLRLADVLIRLEDLGALETLAQTTAERGQAGDLRAHAIAGNLWLLLNQPAMAIAPYEAWVAGEPTSVDALLGLAQARYHSDDQAAARELVEQALTIAPTNPVAANSLIDLLLEAGESAEALAVAEDVGATAPVLGASLQAKVLFAENRPDDAVATTGDALVSAPSTEMMRLHAMTLNQVGDRDEARRRLSAWLVDNPADVVNLELLSQFLIVEGDYEGAALLLEQAARLLPTNAAVLNNLAWLHHELGRDGAATLAQRALLLAPQSAEIADTLGWILVQEGDLETGLALLREAAGQRTDDPNMQYHLAYALREVGEVEDARALLERVLRDHATFMRRSDAESMLAQLGN